MADDQSVVFRQAVETWLEAFLSRHGAVAGSAHWHTGGGLQLVATVHIPPPVRQAVEWVPSGKGMAGLALERGQPVQTCNLQEDRSGAVKPGARAVDAKAAVALPVRNPEGAIVAVVGAAWMDERQLDDETVERLQNDANSLAGIRQLP
jgi:L-methionine (R)-S-oxide reductase